ncbi:MAG: branched-chain amino acid ABC transporter permease [Proteobacteria bacterium]|nr:branched-chain amino acid ABC transporter permease [Pseudomonadota bacterium]
MTAVTESLARRARWRWAEIAFWLVAFGALFLPPGRHLILNEIAILALFALSLDLILGYAGIVSLGHAAFFGLGAYVAGLLAKHVTDDPTAGLVVAMAAAMLLGFATSFLVLRGSDLTRLMVTLGVAMLLGELANALPGLTGGADGLQGVTMGPVLGLFDFDLYGRVAYGYSLTTLFLLMLLARAVVHSPFGLSLMAIRRNRLRASALGVPVNRRLIATYTLAAAFAGAAGALLAQTTAFVSLDFFDFHRSADVLLVLIIGGAGWLYGGILGAVLYEGLQDGISALTPEYWPFWIGLFLVVFVMVGRERMMGGLRGLLARVRR